MSLSLVYRPKGSEAMQPIAKELGFYLSRASLHIAQIQSFQQDALSPGVHGSPDCLAQLTCH